MTLTTTHNQSETILEGELTVATVTELWRNKEALFRKKENTLNLSKIKHADSAGLAFLIELIKEAKEQKRTIKLTNIPKQLKALAELTEVWSFLSSEKKTTT